MSLNINDIDINLFTKYFSENLLANERSDLQTMDTEVLGIKYNITATIKRDKDNTVTANFVYYSPVPLDEEMVTETDDKGNTTYRYPTLEYQFKDIGAGFYDVTTEDKNTGVEYPQISFTVTNGGFMSSDEHDTQLYTTDFPRNKLYKLPTYSEYEIFIKKPIDNQNILDTINTAIPDSYQCRMNLVKVYDYGKEEECHADELQISTSNVATTSTKFYDIATQFVTNGIYEGNLPLKEAIISSMMASDSTNIESDAVFKYFFTKDDFHENQLNLWAFISSSNVTTGDITKHVGILKKCDKSIIPVFNEYGQPLFMDKYGNITTKPDTASQFIKHNTAIRENFFSLTSDKGLSTFLFAPNTIGLCQEGSNYKFVQAMKFKQTFTYEKLDEKPENVKMRRSIINPKITDTIKNNKDEDGNIKPFSYSRMVRYCEDVMNLGALPHYMYFDMKDILEENEEFNTDTNFFILDDIRPYKVGDVIMLDEVDSAAKTKIVNRNRLGIIKEVDTLYNKNDIIVCEPITSIDGVSKITPETYLRKVHDFYGFSNTGRNVNGIPTYERVLYYQNSLNLSTYYKVTETWEGTEDESARGNHPNITGISNDWWDTYDIFEFLKYDHIVINDEYVDWGTNNTAGKPIKIKELADPQMCQCIFYQKPFGHKKFDIIRVFTRPKNFSSNFLAYLLEVIAYNAKLNTFWKNVDKYRKWMSYIRIGALKAPYIEDYIQHFSDVMHYIEDGYLESRGKLLMEGTTKEYEKSIFRSMLTDKVNNIDDTQVFPVISKYDPEQFGKYNVLSKAVQNYHVKNNVASTYSYSRLLYDYSMFTDNNDMLLVQRDVIETAPELHTDETIRALTETYSKNVFQRIYEYQDFPTNYTKTNMLKERLEANKLYNTYDEIQHVQNDIIIEKKAPVKKKTEIEEFYELVARTAVTSLQYNDPGDDDRIISYFNENDYHRITSFLETYEPVVEPVEKIEYISSANISDGVENIGDVVKAVFGVNNTKKEWVFNDVDKSKMKLDYGGKIWTI